MGGFPCVVATAAGQDMGRARDRSQLWGSRDQHPLPLTLQRKHLEEKHVFSEVTALHPQSSPSQQPEGPEAALRPPKPAPCGQRKDLASQDASGPGPAPARQDLRMPMLSPQRPDGRCREGMYRNCK
uniref:Uncharacterized protein n=1 Tax=Myotis myotis TaxID=51298 RepID=A0A7J7S2U3_MYOMY|nr:hypothetical protein mMyoMyo1_010102 [Myotis myotis]